MLARLGDGEAIGSALFAEAVLAGDEDAAGEAGDGEDDGGVADGAITTGGTNRVGPATGVE